MLVVGMHRSGTSAVTGALGRLGLQLPAGGDLVTGGYDNPVHYESRALTGFDDVLMRAIGGSWSSPPLPEEGWEQSAAVRRLIPQAEEAARRAFPRQGAVAWKDPRLCLLLPFWRAVLPQPPAVVFVWRQPSAVAGSLRARQGFTTSLSVALWERYNRAAMTTLKGLDTIVLGFEDVVSEPWRAMTAIARWLEGTGRLLRPVDDVAIETAAASVSSTLVRRGPTDDAPGFTGQLCKKLAELDGVHSPFPEVDVAALPAPPAWADDALSQQREYEGLYAQYLRYVRWRRRLPMAGWLLRRRRRGAQSVGDDDA
ncbi:MAG TPA: hypothetical protein VKU86_02925 [Acidimicrobiales bacterium]|nr:hypothetical protein [Acidimicrobiales bacterium]